MQYEKRFYLYNSAGVCIGFCFGSSLFDTFAIWRGWFPWDKSADVMTPQGNYLGTVVGNRLYMFDHKKELQVSYSPSFPTAPFNMEKPGTAASKKLPNGASDVELKPARLQPQVHYSKGDLGGSSGSAGCIEVVRVSPSSEPLCTQTVGTMKFWPSNCT